MKRIPDWEKKAECLLCDQAVEMVYHTFQDYIFAMEF